MEKQSCGTTKSGKMGGVRGIEQLVLTNLTEFELNDLLRKELDEVGTLENMELLAEKGANLNMVDWDTGDTFLIMSVLKNRLDVVRFLLGNKVSIGWKNNKGLDAVYTAVLHGTLDILKALLDAGASAETWQPHLVRKSSALITAVGNDRWEEALLLVQAGAGLDLLYGGEKLRVMSLEGNEALKYYFTAKRNPEFCKAAYTNDIEKVKEFIANDVNIHSRTCNENGDTPLHSCVYAEFEDIAQQLFYAGANVNVQNYKGDTPLRLAIYKRNYKLMKMLADAGANFNGFVGETHNTYLTHAAVESDTELARALIGYGANIDGRHENGESALHIAVKKENMSMMNLLIEAGAKLEAQDRHRHTPLFYAIKNKDTKSVRRLLEAGAKPDTQNFKSAVQLATNLNDTEFLNALLSKKRE